jgi:hypothetical protein
VPSAWLRQYSTLWQCSIILKAGHAMTLRETWDRSVGVHCVANAVNIEELVHSAFEKSWFVSTDPVIADGNMEELRTRLSHRLSRLAQNGERNVWRLANGCDL